MAAIFVVALTIPELWHDAPGGLNGPVVFVVAYVAIRAVHLLVYSVAAADDAGLRHQLAVTVPPMLAGAALLLAGVLLGGWLQTLLFAAALAVDWGGTYITSRQGNWRLNSPSHWTERHGLFVILVIGESVVAVGVGAARQPVSAPLVTGAMLGVAASVCLWWLYFDVVSLAAEHVLVEHTGPARVKLAIDAYTYGHFPVVAGVVLGALGVEEILAHASDAEPLGWFSAAALVGGFALYLLGLLLFKHRMHNVLSVPRLVTVVVLVAALPVAAVAPPLVALAVVVVLLAALVGVETRIDAQVRRSARAG
jgi:low temperature requirement protein LtrA